MEDPDALAAYVVPAYAGVDRSFQALKERFHELSPRMRGWTDQCRATGPSQGVVPAYAGVDRLRPHVGDGATGCPRVCGGGPVFWPPELGGATLSPRMRGWTACGSALHRPSGVVPAYAGVDRSYVPELSHGRELSPRMRGWTVHRARRARVFQVVPAYAGVDRARQGARLSGRWLSPRMRGWTDRDPVEQEPIARCPRVCGGGPSSMLYVRARMRVVPAYAGVDRPGAGAAHRSPALSPRMRGWTVAIQARGIQDSSCPRVCGGGPYPPGHAIPEFHVVPAYAGVDRPLRTWRGTR